MILGKTRTLPYKTWGSGGYHFVSIAHSISSSLLTWVVIKLIPDIFKQFVGYKYIILHNINISVWRGIAKNNIFNRSYTKSWGFPSGAKSRVVHRRSTYRFQK